LSRPVVTVRRRVRGNPVFAFVRDLVRGFAQRDLLTYASAIAFQMQFALVPLALAGLALLAFLGLGDLWQDELAPSARDAIPEDAFSLLERTVEQILGRQRAFWLTAGVLFALWQLSGALRAVSGALNELYEVEEERPLLRRLLISILVATAIAPLLLGAVVVVALGGRLVGLLALPAAAEALITTGRWVAAAALLFSAEWLVLRYAPARTRPVRWVTLGSALTVGAWLFASAGYGAYVTYVASYASIFGALAAVIVLMTYLYLLAVAFLAGTQADVLARDRRRETA
jgi:membrane protein